MRPCDSCKECEMALVAYVRHKVKRKERGPSRLRNFSGHSETQMNIHKNMTQPPPTTTSNKSHTKASLCVLVFYGRAML